MIRVRRWVAAVVAPWMAGCFAPDPPESRVATDDAEVARAADVGAGPATAPPRVDAASPESAIPDAETPDVVRPDSNVPDAALPDAVIPDAALRDSNVPDAALPDAIAPDAAPPVDPSTLQWACPELDCERDIPDAPEGAPMLCDGLDLALECDLEMPTCDLDDCVYWDGTDGFLVGFPGDGLEGCFHCPVIEVDTQANGETVFFCEDEGGARVYARPFRWCRFDQERRTVEFGDEWLEVSHSYTYDGMGRVVAHRRTAMKDDGLPWWEGSNCRYDEAGRVIATSWYAAEEEDLAFNFGFARCVRYDDAGRALGHERAAFTFRDVEAERCVLSSGLDVCAVCESTEPEQAGDVCADEVADFFRF